MMSESFHLQPEGISSKQFFFFFFFFKLREMVQRSRGDLPRLPQSEASAWSLVAPVAGVHSVVLTHSLFDGS